MIVSTMSRYSGDLACGVEISEPSQSLVGLIEVVGFVELVELLERVPRGTETWMSVEQPVEVRLVGVAEMIRAPQEREAGPEQIRFVGRRTLIGGRRCISRRTRVRPSVNQRPT